MKSKCALLIITLISVHYIFSAQPSMLTYQTNSPLTSTAPVSSASITPLDEPYSPTSPLSNEDMSTYSDASPQQKRSKIDPSYSIKSPQTAIIYRLDLENTQLKKNISQALHALCTLLNIDLEQLKNQVAYTDYANTQSFDEAYQKKQCLHNATVKKIYTLLQQNNLLNVSVIKTTDFSLEENTMLTIKPYSLSLNSEFEEHEPSFGNAALIFAIQHLKNNHDSYLSVLRKIKSSLTLNDAQISRLEFNMNHFHRLCITQSQIEALLSIAQHPMRPDLSTDLVTAFETYATNNPTLQDMDHIQRLIFAHTAGQISPLQLPAPAQSRTESPEPINPI